MPQPNQIDKKREDVKTTRESLLEVCQMIASYAALLLTPNACVSYHAWTVAFMVVTTGSEATIRQVTAHKILSSQTLDMTHAQSL